MKNVMIKLVREETQGLLSRHVLSGYGKDEAIAIGLELVSNLRSWMMMMIRLVPDYRRRPA